MGLLTSRSFLSLWKLMEKRSAKMAAYSYISVFSPRCLRAATLEGLPAMDRTELKISTTNTRALLVRTTSKALRMRKCSMISGAVWGQEY